MTRTGSIPLTAGSIIAGKYQLEKPLARGGMGSVWVARHIALDEPVALKLINRSAYHFGEAEARLRQDAEMRLQREAKSAARLRSPHIVQLLDYGVDRGVPYIVMELLEGEPLGARIRRKGRLSLAVATNIAEQVGKALRRAHKAGIIHRDLKPDNIFLAKIDDEAIVKLLDFGLVKAVRGTLSGEPTQSDMLMGSLHYMSPEQTLGLKDIDHRTDLWSLGVIIFEMITGQSPFGGASIVDVILKIRSGPIPRPSEVAPDLSPELDEFFERALQRNPGQRFASAQAMVAELGALLKRLGPLGKRAPESPSPESERITMEVNSSDFLLEELSNVDTPVARRAVSDAAPTERKPPTFSADGDKLPRPISHSLQLAPTSMVPREASSPDLVAEPPPSAPPSARPPRSRRGGSRFPKTLDAPAGVAPPAPREPPAPAPPKQSPAAEAAPKSRPHPKTVVSAAAALPDAPSASPPSKRRGSIVQPAPSKSPSLPRTVASPVAAVLPEPPKASPPAESAFAKILGRASPVPPEPTKAPAIASAKKEEPPARPIAAELPKASTPAQEKTASAPASPVAPTKASAFAKILESSPQAPTPEPPKASAFAKILESSRPAPMPESPKASAFERKSRPVTTATSAKPDAPGTPPKGSVAELIDQGFAALRAGNRERAKQCWQEAWRRDPENRAVALNLRKLEAKER